MTDVTIKTGYMHKTFIFFPSLTQNHCRITMCYLMNKNEVYIL